MNLFGEETGDGCQRWAWHWAIGGRRYHGILYCVDHFRCLLYVQLSTDGRGRGLGLVQAVLSYTLQYISHGQRVNSSGVRGIWVHGRRSSIHDRRDYGPGHQPFGVVISGCGTGGRSQTIASGRGSGCA